MFAAQRHGCRTEGGERDGQAEMAGARSGFGRQMPLFEHAPDLGCQVSGLIRGLLGRDARSGRGDRPEAPVRGRLPRARRQAPAERSAVRGRPRGGRRRRGRFAQAIRRGEGLRDALPWITRVAFRIAAGELKERRWTAYPLVERSCEMPEPAAELVGALAKLSPKQRAAAVLHFRRLRPRRGRRHHRLDGGGRRRPSEPSPQTAPRPPR